MFNHLFPRPYTDETLNTILMHEGSPTPGPDLTRYNNLYKHEYCRWNMPYTKSGLTWSWNADGTIHVEGTLDTTVVVLYIVYEQTKPVFSGKDKDSSLVYLSYAYTMRNYYKAKEAETEYPNLKLYSYNVKSNENTLWMTMCVMGNVGDVINMNLPAPMIICLTDIFGAGNEPDLNSPEIQVVLDYYKQHNGYVPRKD